MISSRIRLLLGSRVLPGFLAPVVVTIVLGILGMHGIDAHGVGLHGPVKHAEAATPTGAVMAGHAPFVGAAGASNDAPPAGEAALHASSGSDDQTGGTGGSVMLCVAMLAGVAMALLTLLVRRGRLPRVWAILELAGRVRAMVPAVLRLGTGPPAVWRFSVIRC